VSLEISVPLREKLIALRRDQLQQYRQEPFLVAHDVVTLTLGLGPAIYLGLDGRIFIWHYMNDEGPRVTEDLKEIAAGLVIGAKKINLPELTDLLPSRPPACVVCKCGGGRRWAKLEIRHDSDTAHWVVCWECHGLGWHEEGHE
jgi:hypothetical protein